MVQLGMVGGAADKRLPAAFFRTERGREPVREWLQSLDAEDKRRIGEDIKTVEFDWPVGMPLCKPLGEGLFEIRTSLASDRIARILFCPHGGRMVLLHGFIKKSQATPKRELHLAHERKSQMEGDSA